MKTKSDKRMNRTAKAINKMLKNDEVISNYRVQQYVKHRIEGISYYVYQIINIETNKVLDYCSGSEMELVKFNKLILEVNDAINEDIFKLKK